MPKEGDTRRCPGILKAVSLPTITSYWKGEKRVFAKRGPINLGTKCPRCGYSTSGSSSAGERCRGVLTYKKQYGHMGSLFGGGWYRGEKRVIKE